jgi:hypothetical protein
VARGGGLTLYPVAGGPAREVPGATSRDRPLGWIEAGLLVSAAPQTGGDVTLIDVTTGRRGVWRSIAPTDAAGIMNLSLYSLAVTPDGQSYGYSWHRAFSDLYLVSGLG